MNKNELVKEVAFRTDYDKDDVANAIDTMLEVIKEELFTGNEVRLVGFGKFFNKTLKERHGVNPQTGERHTYPSKTVVKFKPSVDYLKHIASEE